MTVKAEEAARTFLSGEYSRRRGYLTHVMAGWDQLAITATVALWAIVIDWKADTSLFAIQLGLAGGFSSILLGFWRFYVRSLDEAIVKLYPALYFCERAVLPAELCTIHPPAGLPVIEKPDCETSLEYVQVENVFFGPRGALPFDLTAIVLILLFAILSVGYAWVQDLITLRLVLEWPHPVGFLAGLNGAGLALIAFRLRRWPRQYVEWPVPPGKKDEAENRLSEHLTTLRQQKRPWAWREVTTVRRSRLDRAPREEQRGAV